MSSEHADQLNIFISLFKEFWSLHVTILTNRFSSPTVLGAWFEVGLMVLLTELFPQNTSIFHDRELPLNPRTPRVQAELP